MILSVRMPNTFCQSEWLKLWMTQQYDQTKYSLFSVPEKWMLLCSLKYSRFYWHRLWFVWWSTRQLPSLHKIGQKTPQMFLWCSSLMYLIWSHVTSHRNDHLYLRQRICKEPFYPESQSDRQARRWAISYNHRHYPQRHSVWDSIRVAPAL